MERLLSDTNSCMDVYWLCDGWIESGYAKIGTGIYISMTSHPTIRKCLIFNNTAVKVGGIGGGQ